MKPYAIFDMDGTLADANDRQHHLRKEPQDWEGFFADMHLDQPIEPIVRLYHELCASPNYEVAIFTGRPERYRKMTEDWMIRHGLPLRPIFCAPDHSGLHDTEVKRRMYEDFIASGKTVSFVVEDRNSVVKMWREIGVTCLHCAEGDF